MLREPGLYLVRDPDDAPERIAFLRRLADSDRGRVVAEVRPGARGLAWLAAAVLEGVGKDLDAGGTGRNAARNWRRASDWLIGGGVSDLFVSRVQLLDADDLELLVELAAEVDTRLWFVVQQTHLRQTHEDVVASWPFEQMTWEAFEEHWEPDAACAATGEALATAAELPFPLIPDDDFMTFLATCEGVLSRSAYKRVDDAFDRGHAAVAAVGQTGDGWQSIVRQLLEDASTVAEATARTRGAQAALFMKGLWLRLDQRLFGLRWDSQTHIELTPPLLAAVSRFPAPQWAAVAVLRALSHKGPAELSELRIGEVSDSRVCIAGREHGLSGTARRLVLAHLAARARDGAGHLDPFFTKEGNSAGTAEQREPLGPRGVQRILRKVGNEIGVELIERKSSWTVEDDAEWARRRGLVLRVLGEV